MRISSVDFVLLTGPYEGSPGTLRSYGIVRITTEDGRIGIGEPYAAVNMPLVTRQIVEALAAHIIGKSINDHADWLVNLYRTCEYFDHRGCVHCVLGSIDWAVHDLLAQQADLPLCKFLNQNAAESIGLYASAGLVEWSPSRVVDEIHAAHERGFRVAKIRVGCGVQSIHAAITQATQVLEAVGAKMAVGVDGGQQVFLPTLWNVDEAMHLAEAVGAHGGMFLEDPILIHDVSGYRRLVERKAVPIAGGEMFADEGVFAQYLAQNALDIAQPDAAVLAGPAACLAVDKMAQKFGKKIIMHGWAGPVAQMQNIHAALAMETCDLVEFCTLYHPLLNDVLEPIWQFENGRLAVPKRSGLGIRLDEETLRRYPFTGVESLIA